MEQEEGEAARSLLGFGAVALGSSQGVGDLSGIAQAREAWVGVCWGALWKPLQAGEKSGDLGRDQGQGNNL